MIREGLKAEDRVIVDGLQRARVGAKVTPHDRRRPVASHESRPALHQPAHSGDGAVDRAADRRRDRLHHAAGLGISASGAADRRGHHAISRRLPRRPFPIRSQPRSSRRSTASRTCCISTARRPRTAICTITVTFKLGTDLDKAQVLVQNRVAIAQPRLPEEVQRNGVVTRKNSPDILMVVFMLSPDDSFDQLYISNYALLQVRDQLLRLDGIGDIQMFGARDYSMRLWLDPDRIATLGLTSGEVVAAIRAQNLQITGGQIGEPPIADRAFQPNLTFTGRLKDPEAVRGHRGQGRRRRPHGAAARRGAGRTRRACPIRPTAFCCGNRRSRCW